MRLVGLPIVSLTLLSIALECVLLSSIASGSEPVSSDRLQIPPGIEPSTAIDLCIQAGCRDRDLTENPRCEDAVFVRRVYLDLCGRIPTLDEVDEFLASPDSNKRQTLIHQLVRSHEFASHFAASFDTMLMGRAESRRQDRRRNGWISYLEKVFAENVPWNEVTRQILLARGSSADRGHIWYLYERKDQHQELAESIARGIFGVDVACAQCHDHPLASEIEQRHYWGLVAFFQRGKNHQGPRGIAIEESAIGGFNEYSDAFSGSTTFAELTFLQSDVVEETRPDDPKQQEDLDELYVAMKDEPRVPRFSRRAEFVDQVLADHPRVARTLVNRVWALLMGRGIVHPIENMDSQHPPSHPQLLEWLARDFEAHGCDVRRLVEAIVRSQAYQRTSTVPDGGVPQSFSYSLEKPLSAESWQRSLAVVLQCDETLVEQAMGAELRQRFPEITPAPLTTLQQAMSLSNFPGFQGLVQQIGVQMAADEKNVGDTVDLLVRRAYGRRPADEERDALVRYVESRPQRKADAYAQILWAVLTSAEFRLNH